MRWSRGLSRTMITSAPSFCWTLLSLEHTALQWSRQWEMPMASCGKLAPELPCLSNPWRTPIPSKFAYSSSKPSSLYSRSHSRSLEVPTPGFKCATSTLHIPTLHSHQTARRFCISVCVLSKCQCEIRHSLVSVMWHSGDCFKKLPDSQPEDYTFFIS